MAGSAALGCWSESTKLRTPVRLELRQPVSLPLDEVNLTRCPAAFGLAFCLWSWVPMPKLTCKLKRLWTLDTRTDKLHTVVARQGT
jgi:hypothetical protein